MIFTFGEWQQYAGATGSWMREVLMNGVTIAKIQIFDWRQSDGLHGEAAALLVPGQMAEWVRYRTPRELWAGGNLTEKQREAMDIALAHLPGWFSQELDKSVAEDRNG